MEKKFINITRGQELFSTIDGIVVYERQNTHYVFVSDLAYSHNGRLGTEDKHPTLFLSAKHASEYFASIKTKHTRKAFINIYPNELLIYRSKATAMNSRLIDCITTIETTLEWEE